MAESQTESAEQVRARLLRLADEWEQAERAADDYGPSCAYTGYDCAGMLREALVLPLIGALTVWCSSCLPGRPCFACETPSPPPSDLSSPPASTPEEA